MGYWRWLLVAGLVLAIDAGSKYWVQSTMPYGHAIEIIRFFNLMHVWNPGSAFSFLADAGGWRLAADS